MSKNKDGSKASATEDAGTTESPAATSGQTGQVRLPNGELRIEYIRNNFYGDDPDVKGNRGEITRRINTMLVEAGRETEQIAYQIVFSATKSNDIDPRIESKRKAVARKALSEEKTAAKKAEKEEAATAKAAKAAEAAAAATETADTADT